MNSVITPLTNSIEESKVAHIPKDWQGAMGVPITFLSRHDPEQFVVKSANDLRFSDQVPVKKNGLINGLIKDKGGSIDGKSISFESLFGA